MSNEQPIDVRDMAIIHHIYREAYDESARLVRAAPAPSPGRVTFLADHIDFNIAMLHVHHEGEDKLLYPRLIERVPDQVPMTEEVEHEHQLISTALESASAACAAWRQRPSAETGEALAAALDQLNAVAQSHLDDEEQKIVPLAAVTLTQREWDALGKYSIARIPRNKRLVHFGFLLDVLDEDDRAYMMKTLPAPIRPLILFLVGRSWTKYASTLRPGTMRPSDAGSLKSLTPKQQEHFRRSRRMLTRFPHLTPRLFGGAHRAVFRLTGGRLGGTMQGTPIGLLTTTGRRSGRTRTVPIGYTDDGSRFLVAASNFGMDAPPAWYLNLRAHPNAEFHTPAGIERVVARELTDAEREELWPRLLEHHPIWGACQSCTERQIALVALQRPQRQNPA